MLNRCRSRWQITCINYNPPLQQSKVSCNSIVDQKKQLWAWNHYNNQNKLALTIHLFTIWINRLNRSNKSSNLISMFKYTVAMPWTRQGTYILVYRWYSTWRDIGGYNDEFWKVLHFAKKNYTIGNTIQPCEFFKAMAKSDKKFQILLICKYPYDQHSWLSKDAPWSSEERAFLRSPSLEAAHIFTLCIQKGKLNLLTDNISLHPDINIKAIINKLTRRMRSLASAETQGVEGKFRSTFVILVRPNIHDKNFIHTKHCKTVNHTLPSKGIKLTLSLKWRDTIKELITKDTQSPVINCVVMRFVLHHFWCQIIQSSTHSLSLASWLYRPSKVCNFQSTLQI